MSTETRTPNEILSELKENLDRRGRLEGQIRSLDRRIAADTAKVAPLFPLGQERRFKVGPSWDVQFCRATMTVDGLVVTFETFDDLSSLKWPAAEEDVIPVEPDGRGQAPTDPARDLIDVELSTEPAAALEPVAVAADPIAEQERADDVADFLGF